ncbi:MAG: cation diffusion facilitator family transporter, partial [Elusimicrobiota bacterium]|nr:cation diffusion facilitator family transporter [Elusimicrobiota bacterium]
MTDSDVLKADGWHHRSDAIITLIIIIGFFFYSRYPWVDGVLGLMVSGVIIYSAYEIIKDASKSILGTTMPEELKDKICKIIEKKYPRVEDAHHFHIHKYGQHAELTMHICLPETITLETAHDIIDILENEIYEKFKIDTTIHPDCRIHKT